MNSALLSRKRVCLHSSCLVIQTPNAYAAKVIDNPKARLAFETVTGLVMLRGLMAMLDSVAPGFVRFPASGSSEVGPNAVGHYGRVGHADPVPMKRLMLATVVLP